MKVLITGCAGFIGSHLTEALLSRGYKVIGVDCFTDYYPREIKESNLKSSLKNSDFVFIEKDLLKIDLNKLLDDVDYVFHQAAQAGVRASWGGNFEIYTKNNILATQKLLEGIKNSNVKKIIYASSSSIYGDVKSFPINEDLTPRPISPYGVSKLAGEHLCYLYWKNFGVKSISLRYFTVYGPRQRPDMGINKFVIKIYNDELIEIFGDGEQTRDFTYVLDVVNANILAMESNIKYDLFNIGGGSKISVNELIKNIEKITEKKATIKYIKKQKGDVLHTHADISKAKEILGWEPRVNIKEGLKKYVEWYKN